MRAQAFDQKCSEEKKRKKKINKQKIQIPCLFLVFQWASFVH